MVDFPNKKYDLILADPPWVWETFSEKGQKKSPGRHYSYMSFDEIKNLPVSEISNEDSLCLLWATKPLLPEQIMVLEHWGFEYKTILFNWLKLNKKSPTPFIGCGYYSRANMEYLLLGRKGNPSRPKKRDISDVVPSPIRDHSQKPDIIHEHIEAMYPDASKIELFGRTKRNGWDIWGNEINKYSTLELFCN